MHITALKSLKVNKEYMFFNPDGYFIIGKVIRKLQNPNQPPHRREHSAMIQEMFSEDVVLIHPQLVADFKELI